DRPNPCGRPVNQSWTGPNGDISIFHSLIAFQVTFFILSIVAATLPIPSGIFMPVFVLGGAFGRMTGELLRLWNPNVSADFIRVIHPGAYAVVGAGAFCGAVTHTVSVAVIVFELTGQLVLLIPVMIAVLVANAVSSYLQPSIYDSIIKIKRLPYLPDIAQSSSMYHSLSAEQFMTTPVAYVSKDFTYGEVQELILEISHVRAFPMVENRRRFFLSDFFLFKIDRNFETNCSLTFYQAHRS
ncbi:Chloride transporter ClC family, partial [Trichostrongylus colubriformis]